MLQYNEALSCQGLRVEHDQLSKVLFANKKRLAYLLFAFSLILLMVVGFIQRTAITNQLHAWQVLPQPDQLTELYFEDHQKLPTTYHVGNSETVKFTTHNLEQQQVSYGYKLYAASEDGTARVELGSGSFTIDHNQQHTVSVAPAIPDLGQRVRVSIELHINGVKSPTGNITDHTQSLHYWVTKR